MTNSDDPLYIVPAVVPDEEPVSSKRSVSRSATTQVVPVRTGDTASPPDPTVEPVTIPSATATPESSASRTIRFERPAVRRTTRTLRYIDPWSVFRVALVAHLVLYVVLLLAGVLLWNVANATGTVDNVERFMESFGWESFEFKGGELFHQAWILGLFAVVGLTGLVVLAVTTFNLITDLVGGVRLTVLEGAPARRPADRRNRAPEQAVESERPHR
ncbi:MAG: DUF3566 domain-containing protein [Actinomycetota bacterium]